LGKPTPSGNRVAALQIEHVPIDQLRPDPADTRKITDAELEALTRSIHQFGLVAPIIAQRQGGLVVGEHQRLVAARRLGLTTVPVTFLDLPLEQARLLNIALNKISGEFDQEMLARLRSRMLVPLCSSWPRATRWRPSLATLLPVIPQTLAARTAAELAKRLSFDLPDTLTRDVKLAPHLHERATATIL
jgi:hypothetical protein